METTADVVDIIMTSLPTVEELEIDVRMIFFAIRCPTRGTKKEIHH